jgi:hypothetical protein
LDDPRILARGLVEPNDHSAVEMLVGPLRIVDGILPVVVARAKIFLEPADPPILEAGVPDRRVQRVLGVASGRPLIAVMSCLIVYFVATG